MKFKNIVFKLSTYLFYQNYQIIQNLRFFFSLTEFSHKMDANLSVISGNVLYCCTLLVRICNNI